jgi:hypothetical protein
MPNQKALKPPSWLPKPFRKPMLDILMTQTILDYYNSLEPHKISEEEHEALSYIRKEGIQVFPYHFQDKYKKSEVEVFVDAKNGLKYVIENDRKLYFKRKSSERGVKRNYNALRIEQDVESAHRYLTQSFEVEDGDILVDVGAAEGNLPLSVMHKVKKVYLFETDPKWIEALQATFEPWKEKVEIINKYVSDKNNDTHVTLDTFFKDKEPFTFLKVDAEGAETSILEGCRTILAENKPMKIAMATYHKPHDAEEIELFINQYHFKSEFSEGFMIFPELKTFSPPYLRRGLIRAKR